MFLSTICGWILGVGAMAMGGIKFIVPMIGQEFLHNSIKAMAQPIMGIVQASGWLDADTWSVMSQYGESLVDKALEGKIHDTIGNNKKIDSMMDILTRTGKGNPCIVGEAGVGKTALVEGLAYRIAHGDVPEDFKNKKIIKVNMVNLIAGKAYNNGVGAVGRMRALFDKASQDPNIILFIDEFHQIVQCNAAELFKTYLDRGDIRIIAATTTSEYSYIANDPALERRFTKVILEEPTPFETFEILKGLRSEMENKNKVKISDESLLASVELTGRYMKNRSYPDKAIDVVSSAVKKVSRRNKILNLPMDTSIVTEEDIRNIVSSETSIPLGTISKPEAQRLESMEERLKCRIKGQNEAIKCVSDAVRRARIGVSSCSKPRGSFLFLGTSGVGKTELAKAVGDEVGNLITVDLSQPNAQDLFIEKVWKKPYSIVLFEGVEDASPRMFSRIRGILQNGYTVDASGHNVDFTNTIIIMTSNIGEKLLLSASENEDKKLVYNNVLAKVRESFGIVFSNYIDEILVFNKFNSKDFKDIANIFIESLKHRLGLENINLKVDSKVINYVSSVKIDHTSGALQLQKIICEKIEKPIAKLIIEGKIKKGDILNCTMLNNKISFDVE